MRNFGYAIAVVMMSCSMAFAGDSQTFDGEKLTYRLRWGAITAGTATFTADANHDFNGTPAMKLTK